MPEHDIDDMIRNKQALYDAERSEASTRVHRLDRTPTELLSLACRVLARQGHSSGLAGQLTCRDSLDPSTYWTQSLGFLLDEAFPDTMIRVGLDLDRLEGTGMVNPANRFHSTIYRARPDVGAIVHTHAPYASALSMLDEPLRVAHMDAMALFDDVGWVQHWPGVPYGETEGRLIHEALGERRALLLANHGLLTIGRDIEEATYLASVFELASRLQITARSAGPIKEVDSKLGRDARQHTLDPVYAVAHFNAWVRDLPRSGRCPHNFVSIDPLFDCMPVIGHFKLPS